MMIDHNAIYGVFHYAKRPTGWHFSACETAEEAGELAARLAVGEGILNYDWRYVSMNIAGGIFMKLWIVPHVEPDEEDDDAEIQG